TLALFAGAESLSNHPLAKAIINYAAEHGVEPERNLHIEDVPGFGIKAETDQGDILIGKPKFVGEELVEDFQNNVAVSLANEGKTVIFMRDEQGIVALAALQDTLRKEAISAIKSLQSLGLHTVMLTGDNE